LTEHYFIHNFNSFALPSHTPLTVEKPYWRIRAGDTHVQNSLLLAAAELGKTLFESAKYDEQGSYDH
jgi:hypothetical protein